MSENDLQQDVEDLKDRVADLEAMFEENPDAASKAMDLSSFIRGFDPSTHIERATSIAYYLEKYEGQEQFTRADIEEGYKNCRMNLPSNMSDVLAGCEERGWVMRDGQDGQTNIRKLTMDGLDMVEEVIEDGS